jgi:hypothetical protein
MLYEAAPVTAVQETRRFDFPFTCATSVTAGTKVVIVRSALSLLSSPLASSDVTAMTSGTPREEGVKVRLVEVLELLSIEFDELGTPFKAS